VRAPKVGAAGKHNIKAKYPGDKNWVKSDAKAKFTAK
jgi:hypothetical protein